MDQITEPIESFWVVIPHYVLSNKKLEHIDKLVYGEISALTRKDGICYAHNKHFEEVLGITQKVVTSSIKRLEEQGFIVSIITHIMNGKRGTYRQIGLKGVVPKGQGGYAQKDMGGRSKGIDKIDIHKRDTYKNVENKFSYSKQDNSYDKNEAERIRSKTKKETENLLSGNQYEKLKQQGIV